MNTDIIPISYVGGTGGNFLSYLVVAAKYNDYEKYPLILSDNGNAHASPKDFPMAPYPLHIDDNLKINYLTTYTKFTNIEKDKIKPYYTAGHIVSNKLIVDTFAKSIRIIYDTDDIKEITHVFLGKYISDSLLVDTNKHKISPYYISMEYQITKYSKFFIYEPQYDSALYISWKELCRLRRILK